MKKVTINVSSKDYTITLEDGFAKAFQKDLETLTAKKKNIDVKDLLGAFIQKSYDLYMQDQKLQENIKLLEDKFN